MLKRYHDLLTKRTLPLIFIFGTVLIAHAQDDVLISGYGNTHLMDHSGTPKQVGKKDLDDSFFQLREFSLFMDFPISEAIIASAELEAGDNGSRYTANYAYVDVQVRDELSLRAGKILVPFLSYNENKPNFKQHLMSQPFTAWNLAPVVGLAIDFRGFGWSDTGVTANWNRSMGSQGILDLKLGLINGLGSDSNVLDDNAIQLSTGPVVRPRDGLLQNETNNELRDNNSGKAKVAKATFQSLEFPVDAGVSWYLGDWDPEDKHALQMVGAHLNWMAAKWTVKGEYVLADVEQEAGIDPVADAGLPGPAGLNTSQSDYSMKAWYLEGSFVPKRWEKDQYVRLVFRLDDVDTNDNAPFTPFDRGRITVGAEWQFAPNSRLRYEWQKTTIDDFEKAPLPFRMAGGKEEINMNMASVIFSF